MRWLPLLLLAGCVTFGRGPLPAEVEGVVDYLEARNFRLVPDRVAYDQAFERVDSTAHVMTFEVSAVEPPPRRFRRPAFIDVYQFQTDAATATGVRALLLRHCRGDVYADGPLVVCARGDVADLELVLLNRFGSPVLRSQVSRAG